MSAAFHRREPVFTEWPEAPAATQTSPPPSSPISASSGVHPSARTTPWLGLALAAVVLAAPSLTPGSIAGRLAAATPTTPAASPSVPRLADQDEVQFSAFTLKLAGGSSADDLWRRWNELRQRQLGMLDDLTPSVKPVARVGSGYVLLAGAFRNAGAAADACGTLRARRLTCEVVLSSGATLDERS